MSKGDGEYTSSANSETTKWLQNHGVVVVYFVAIAVIILELLPLGPVTISWEIVALITLLLVAPFIGNLRRVWVSNVGGVELENDIQSAQKSVSEFLKESPDLSAQENSIDGNRAEDSTEAKENTDKSTELSPDEYIDDLGGTPREISDELYRLLESDPRLALAKLRMEMDETIDSFLETMGYSGKVSTQDRYRIMSEIDHLDPEVLHTHKEVRNLCNKAIHGEDIRIQDAIEIIDMGIDFLAGMKSRELYERFKKGEEIEEEELDAILNESATILDKE